jgi:hypothetical protein
MIPDDTTPSPCAHAPAPTDLCDATFERRYVMKDRLARGLFNAVCRSQGVDAYTRGTSSTAPIYVTADAAGHARLWARWVELVPRYDDCVLSAASDFIREHCGVELPPAPRK